MERKSVRKLFTPLIVVLSFLVIGTSAVSAAGVDEEDDWTGYSDVTEENAHYGAIMALTEQGIIQGYENNEFRPWENLTRQHAAVILSQVADFETPEDIAQTLEQYSDVDSDSRYAEQIAILTEAGVFKGDEDGNFNPQENITRQQMATVLVLAFDLEERFGDMENVEVNLDNVTESHKERVQIIANLGLTVALEDFRPKEDISRGAFSTLVHNTQSAGHVDLSIMHMNDTHARVDDMPKMITAIKQVREEKPDSLLLHAGDAFSGTLYFNEFEGLADLELMNLMGLDAMVFGNHEFDLGSSDAGHQALAYFVEHANFPFVASNVDFSKDEHLKDLVGEPSFSDSHHDGEIYNHIVKEVDGEKVGIFGLTTEDTVNIASPGAVEFSDYLNAAEDAVAAFEEQGIDKIIALTHIGYDNHAIGSDLLLAEVEGIDVIVGGHSHTQLSEPVIVDTDANGEEKDPTVIVQANEYVKYLGTLDVVFDENGVIVGHAGALLDLNAEDEEGVPLYEEDREASLALAGYKAQVDKVANTESDATALEEFPNPRHSEGSEVSVRANETGLGNLITDGMLEKAKEVQNNFGEPVIAMQNGGGIRTSIDEGPVTYGEIISVLPFGNTLAVAELSGAEIIEILEHSVKDAPAEFGGFLHVSGMKFAYDSTKEAGDRIVSVEVQVGEGEDAYEALEEDQTYVIATNAFTAKGGDGFETFAAAYDNGQVQDLGLSDWENLRDHMESLGDIEPILEDRIVDVANQNEEAVEE